jgi:hypothetical protein
MFHVKHFRLLFVGKSYILDMGPPQTHPLWGIDAAMGFSGNSNPRRALHRSARWPWSRAHLQQVEPKEHGRGGLVAAAPDHSRSREMRPSAGGSAPRRLLTISELLARLQPASTAF